MDDDDDGDIFNMLLKDTNNKGKQTKETKAKTNNDRGKDSDEDYLSFDLKYSIDSTLSPHPSTQNESELLEHIYKQTCLILDRCTDDTFLYVLVDSNGLAFVNIYRLQSYDASHTPNILAVLPTCMKSTLFKATDKDRTERRCFYIIHQHGSPDTSIPSASSLDRGNIHIPSSSFASLFGKTTSLVKSAVLLLCANDGCVYWRPVKSVNQEGRFHLMCQLHDLVSSVIPISVKKKFDDEEVAKAVHAALRNDDDGDGDGSERVVGLLVVSHIGECCLLVPAPPTPRLPPQTSQGEWFPIRFCLPHQVVCCVEHGNRLIYSTGWSVQAASLCLKHDGNTPPSISLQDCVTLTTAKIERLFLKTTPGNSDTQLMGLTSDLDTIPIPTTASSGAKLADRLLPDTIQNIQKHTTSMQELRDKSKTLDSHLLQLNLFASLFQQHQKKNSADVDKSLEPIIHCDCFIHQRHGYGNKSEVRVQIRNDSKTYLSDSWSVLVTVVPELCFSVSEVSTQSFCFKVNGGLYSNSKATYCIPFPECVNFDPLSKLRVYVSLVFTPIFCQSFVTVTRNKEDPVLEVEICRQTFDYLHFLRLSDGDDSMSVYGARCSNQEMKVLLEKLGDKKLKSSNTSKDVADGPGNEKMVTKMLVPELVEPVPEMKEDVLKTLLTNIGHFPEGTNSMTYVSPRGEEICMRLERVPAKVGTDQGTATTTTTATTANCLQLTLESCDIVLLSVVFMALVDRFQELSSNQRKIAPMVKVDLEKQLSALKNIRSCLSKRRPNEMVSTLHNALNCLGTCVL